MKKIISALLIAAFMITALCGCSVKQKNRTNEDKINYDKVKAVWISCYEMERIFYSSEKGVMSDKLNNVFLNLSQMGINTVFVHIRAFSDAFYESDIFPDSTYLPADKNYDALELVLESAHKYKLSVHAWINPYRISSSPNISSLNSAQPAAKWYKSGHKNRLIICSSGIYYNPSDLTAQKLIIDSVREVCKRYDVDGIHFDDYFYPDTSEKIDKASYESYRADSGNLSLSEFRTQSVSAMIEGVYNAIKSINGNILFGISPQASIENNKKKLYADVQEWAAEKGYVDYLCPQIYFGFKNEISPFEKCLDNWAQMKTDSSVRLIAGLALYKSGKNDNYASGNHKSTDSPYFEWKNYSDIISRQVKMIENEEAFSGYAIYSYSYLTDDNPNSNLREETENLKVELAKP